MAKMHSEKHLNPVLSTCVYLMSPHWFLTDFQSYIRQLSATISDYRPYLSHHLSALDNGDALIITETHVVTEVDQFAEACVH